MRYKSATLRARLDPRHDDELPSKGVAPPRVIDPTGLYHVFSRGNYRARIFLDDDHFTKYLSLLTRVSNRYHWTVLDWCLMPNHYHLFLRLEDGGLSEGMRELNGCFSRWSNRETGRTGTGHFVKNRFGMVDVLREGQLWELVSYIPLNPVRAGLVKRPEDWPWSGYRATAGLEHPRDFHRPYALLRLIADGYTDLRARYISIVEEARVRGEQGKWSDQVA